MRWSIPVFLACLVPASVLAQSRSWIVVRMHAGEDTAQLERAAHEALELLHEAGEPVLEGSEIALRLQRALGVRESVSRPGLADRIRSASERGLLELVRGRRDRAREVLSPALSEVRPVVSMIARDDEIARVVGDACLFVVRSYLEGGSPEQARTEAMECFRLVPDRIFEVRLHPPEVLQLLEDAAQDAQTAGTALVIEGPHAECIARVNGRPMATSIPARLALGEGQAEVQLDCAAAGRSRIRRIQIVRGATVTIATDPLLDRALGEADSLRLTYQSVEDVVALGARHVVQLLALVGATDAILIRGGRSSTLLMERYSAGSPRAVATARVALDAGGRIAPAVGSLLRGRSAEPAAETAQVPSDDEGPSRVGPIVLLAAGAGALGVAVYGLARSGSCLTEMGGICVEESEVAPATWVWGSAGLAAVIGGVMWFLLDNGGETDQPVAVNARGIEVSF